MNIFKIVLCFFVFALLQACQKDTSNTPDPVVPKDSATTISKLIYIDFRVSAADTLGYSEFIYDDLKRVKAINTYDYGNGSMSLSEVYTYYYNGNDSIVYKVTDQSIDPLNSIADTTFYFYDNLQRLTKDSTVFSTGTVVQEFSYSATMITASQEVAYFADPLNKIINYDTGYIGGTGDVIKTNSLLLSTEHFSSDISYDNKPNPFHTLNIHTTFNPVPDRFYYVEGLYLQKNNIVLITTEGQSSPGMVSTETYTYSYNTMNLPSSVDITYSFGQIDDYRILFVYRKI